MVDEKEQFKADRNMWGRAHSGWRDPANVLWGVFHTTENSDSTPPDNVAQWQLNTANESSYNVLFGTDGRTVRSNDDDYNPWAVGMPGNRLGFHASAIGYASRTREQWLAFPDQIEALARWAADLHTRYGIPLRWLTVDQVRAQREKGFTDHATYWQAIGKAKKMAVRTDPGAGFPADVILTRAGAIARGEVKKDMPKSEDNRLDLALDQLVGHPWNEWAGWPQLAGLSLVDALATVGCKLGIKGFTDKRNDELRAADPM